MTRRLLTAIALLLALTGCREVRVKTYAQGTTTVAGANQIVVVRNRKGLEELGIRAPVRFNHEFGVVLVMGPHDATGYRQLIESIRANDRRVRIVAFERAPAVTPEGEAIDVVTPEGEAIATTQLH